jgi:hypothetical protein
MKNSLNRPEVGVKIFMRLQLQPLSHYQLYPKEQSEAAKYFYPLPGRHSQIKIYYENY